VRWGRAWEEGTQEGAREGTGGRAGRMPRGVTQPPLVLPAPSLASHGRQYQVLQQLAATYESEPDNFPRLMELMQDLQALGQLPAQLLRCAAPGLELTAEGLPALALCAPADVAAAVPLGGCQVQ